MAKFCGNCGREVKAEVSFCPYCGKKIKNIVYNPVLNNETPESGHLNNSFGLTIFKYLLIAFLLVLAFLYLYRMISTYSMNKEAFAWVDHPSVCLFLHWAIGIMAIAYCLAPIPNFNKQNNKKNKIFSCSLTLFMWGVFSCIVSAVFNDFMLGDDAAIAFYGLFHIAYGPLSIATIIAGVLIYIYIFLKFRNIRNN